MTRNINLLQLRERVEQLAYSDDLQQILVPVYMPNHWGLIFVDLASQEMYFDDGLMSAVTPIAVIRITPGNVPKPSSPPKQVLAKLLQISAFWYAISNIR